MTTKATLQTSDWHFGDVAMLYATWRECHTRAIQVINKHRPDVVEVVVNGDAVAGAGIFRNQHTRLVLQRSPNQALWAAWEIRKLHNQISSKVGRVIWSIVWGNHDDANNVDLAELIVLYLTAMGIEAQYYPESLIGSLAVEPRRGTHFHASHGFGGSDYYAQSYSGMREMMRLGSEIGMRHDINVSLFMRAHTHFFDPILPVGYQVAASTAGGWHKQTRWNLSRALRDTGVIVFVDTGERQLTGAEFLTIPIYADAQTLEAETANQDLETDNQERATQQVREALRWLRESRGQ